MCRFVCNTFFLSDESIPLQDSLMLPSSSSTAPYSRWRTGIPSGGTHMTCCHCRSFYVPLCFSSHWSVVIKFFIFPTWAIFLFFSFGQTSLRTQMLPFGQNNVQLPYFIHAKPGTCCCILLCTEKCLQPNAHLLWLSGGSGTILGSTKDLTVFLPFLTIGWQPSFSLPALRLYLREHAAPSQIDVSFPRHSQ